jgi:hypothetical protein
MVILGTVVLGMVVLGTVVLGMVVLGTHSRCAVYSQPPSHPYSYAEYEKFKFSHLLPSRFLLYQNSIEPKTN